MKLTDADIVNAIRAGLGTEKAVNEAYIVGQKTFDIKTDALSGKTIVAHEQLLSEYVDTLNEVSAQLDTVDRAVANSDHSTYRSLKIDESYNLNACFLHGMYFDNIGKLNSVITADTLTFMRLERDFGSFDDWQRDFIACAMSARSGWAVLVYNAFLKRYVNTIVDLHSSQVPINSYPIIVLDVWEHAYYRDYLDDRKAYVFAMMKELNWELIEQRVDRAEKIGKVLT